MATDSSDSGQDSVLERVFYPEKRIQLLYWQDFSGARTTVLLMAAITVLTFITGLSTLSQEELVLEGPLAALLPDVTGFVRFAGVLFSVLLAIVTFGLNRGKRMAWYAGVTLLPLVALLPLLTLETIHMPIFFLIVLTLPALLYNHAQFDQSLDLSSLQIASLLSIFGVLAYGAIGSYMLRDEFVELETWSDAIYYVIVTIATVGYGDITPTTTESQWFALSVILLGTGAFTVAIGSFIVPAIEKRMASAFGNMTPAHINLLEDHILVLGYSDITESLLDELVDEREAVVVTPDEEVVTHLDSDGVNVLTADPTDEDNLDDAGIDVASGVVVATDDDAEDVLAVLAAREANPDIYIAAAAINQNHVSKLEQVGADEVISPMTIGGQLLGRSVIEQRSSRDLLDGGAPTRDEKSQSEGKTGNSES